ncbi:hypothetical protein NHQ30_005949 [Ciborinia camelliae]|nr:hypothetical protein NHQ30_005949 [Ciborinia camelliae]
MNPTHLFIFLFMALYHSKVSAHEFQEDIKAIKVENTEAHTHADAVLVSVSPTISIQPSFPTPDLSIEPTNTSSIRTITISITTTFQTVITKARRNAYTYTTIIPSPEVMQKPNSNSNSIQMQRRNSIDLGPLVNPPPSAAAPPSVFSITSSPIPISTHPTPPPPPLPSPEPEPSSPSIDTLTILLPPVSSGSGETIVVVDIGEKNQKRDDVV